MTVRRPADQQPQRRHRALGHRWADLPLRAKGLVVVAMPLAALVVAALLFGLAMAQDREAQGWVLHTVGVENRVAEVRALALEAETGARGYLLTGRDDYLEPYELARRTLPSSVDRLGSLIRDNPSQVDRLELVRRLADRRLQISAEMIASARTDRLPRSAISLLEQGKQTSSGLHQQLDAMQEEEQRLLDLRQAAARRTRTVELGAIGLSVVVGLAGGVAATLLFTSGVTRRAEQLEGNAERLAEGLALRPGRPGNDELGSLGRGLERAAVLLGERELALREAKLAADQANQAKSEYLSRMSHELRTPLNAIMGFAQLLELDELRDEQRDSLGHILSGARHLLSLINEVLDIAAIEAGRLSLSLEPVALADVAAETVSLIRPLADQHSIVLVGPNVSCATHVLGDRQRLKQVLLNLLSNAVKYNREGGSVHLTCEPVPDERLRIKITDTGLGIPPEALERLFVPFERVASEQRAIEGTGLGLPLSKRLAEAMGGTLELVSTPQQGSTFWIELPVVESPIQRDERQQQVEPPPAQEQAEQTGPTLTVLYIEDNLSNLQLVERVLGRRPGVRLISAMRPQLGLDLAGEHHPDLLLLDLHLPDMPGEEVLRRLQTNPKTAEIPVAILSADARPGLIQRLLEQGARTFLTKPLDVKELLELIDTISAERRQPAWPAPAGTT